jgi:uncharacterized membrane protein
VPAYRAISRRNALLFVIIYPALRPTPLTTIAVAIAYIFLAIGAIALALVLPLLFALIAWLPVLAIRAIYRERRRRHHRFPSL